MKFVQTLKPLALVLTAGLMLSAFAAPAMAQGGGGGGGGRGGMGGGGGGGGMFGGGGGGMFGQQMGAPVGKADIEKMTKSLNLTADQQTAAQALLDGYLAGFNKKSEEYRKLAEDARAAARESGDWSTLTDLQPKTQEFRKYRTDSEKQFFEDVKGVLDKKQVEQWPAYERSHKREQSMSRGMMSGERADVVALVDRMKLSPEKSAGLKSILDAYGVEIEKPLEIRNAAQEKFMNDGGMRAIFNPDADEATRKKAEDMVKEGRDAAIAVRDINRKYAKQVESALGGAEGEKFAAEFRKSSFPSVYGREAYIDRAITAAEGMKDLQPGQLDGIKALKEQYVRDVKPMDEAAAKAIEEREASFSIANMGNMRGQGDAGQETRRQRREVEDGALTKLKAILTPEQAANLPERQGRGGEGGGGGGDNGGQRRQRGAGQGGNDGNNSGGDQPRRQRGGGGTGAAPRDANPPAPRN